MSDTADLAALDALFAAATAHRKAQAARRQKHGDEWVQAGAFVDDAAAKLFVALDALDLPALRRELEIGRAAVEVMDAAHAWEDSMLKWRKETGVSMKDTTEPFRARLDAARAKLRALRETKDA